METIKTEVRIDSDIYELIPGFSEARKKELDDLQLFLKNKDYISISKISHTIKGIARPYGFPTLEALFVRLEVAARNSDSESCAEILTEIKNYFIDYSF